MKYYSNGNELIKYIVVLIDFVLLNITMALFYHYAQEIVPAYFRANPRIIYLIANIAMVIAQFFVPSVIHYRRISFEQVASRVARMVILQAAITFIFVRLICDGGGFFRYLFIYMFALFVIIMLARLAERHLLKYIRQMGRNNRSVIFIGDDPAVLQIYNEITEDPSTGYKIKGYYSNNAIPNCPEKFTHIGNLADLDDFMDKEQGHYRHVDEVFCCLSQNESEQLVRIMQYCDRHVMHFYYIPRMFGNFRLNLKPERFGDQIIFTNRNEPLAQYANKFIKRTFDIVVSLVVCIILIPFIPIIALIIKRQSPGPIFFKQERTGFNGQSFTCYKFRSMHINKAADMQQASIDDPRKFPFGNFMRKTNIDEFPQFFNVLRGDMSIVGPRPHMTYHTEMYSQIIDKYMVRHFSKPGITGYAQVTGFRGETKELWQMEERIRRDIWYIENWTFWLDIKIIFLTAVSLFKPDKKAY